MIADPSKAGSAGEDLIKDGSDAGFAADVVAESRNQPVLVDFWASWCGPCRQLTPALEKAVRAAGGKVKLVKIDVDKNPVYAGQLRVQSIPTVYAFVDGQLVDGFMGALPDSQIADFIGKLTGAPSGPPPEIEHLLGLGAESLKLNDLGGAAQAYAQVLQLEPGHPKAVAGMARVYLADGDPDQARQTLAMAPDSRDPDIEGVRAALALKSDKSGGSDALKARVEAAPDDHQARFDLAAALAADERYDEAVDHLLKIVAADREWNDQAARKQLLTVFDAAGAASSTAREGRRRLSSILFA